MDSHGAFLPVSSVCSSYMKHASGLKTKSTMFRCFPEYAYDTDYACDDDGDGVPGTGLDPVLNASLVAAQWRTAAYTSAEAKLCGTMIQRVMNQAPAQDNPVSAQLRTVCSIRSIHW